MNGKLYLKEGGYESTLSQVFTEYLDGSYKVDSYTYDSLIEKYNKFKSIDLLSVDVVGHENKIFTNLINKKIFT